MGFSLSSEIIRELREWEVYIIKRKDIEGAQ